MDDIPNSAAINEAVELAKAFGSDNSSKFINGVLGCAYRQIYPEVKEDNEQSTKAKEDGNTSGAEAK